MIDFKKLIEAGVQFGHKKSRWNPHMEPYIWGIRNDIHLIDVSKTARQLERAAKFLESVAAQGKCILLIGTKKAAREAIMQAGKRLHCPFVVHRWIGGTLTNFSQVKKSLTKLLHFEDVIQKADRSVYTKKELGKLQKSVDRLTKNVGDIRNMSWPIGALVIVDVKKEQTSLREAAALGIPIVALVDTNSDPSLVDYVIPTNDDAPKSIRIIVDYLADEIEKGQKEATQKPQGVATSDKQQENQVVEELEGTEEEFAEKPKKEKAVIKKVKVAEKDKEPVKKSSVAQRSRSAKKKIAA